MKVEHVLTSPPSPAAYAVATDLDFTEGSSALMAAVLEAIGART